MPTVVSTPVLTYISTIFSDTGMTGSNNLTATAQITGAWELRIPLHGVQAANVSAGPELWIYPALGGAQNAPKFATVPMQQIAITRSASAEDYQVVRVDAGIYALRLISGGPNTATVGLGTGEVLTAVINV